MDKKQVTVEGFNRNARLYQDRFMNLDIYNETYEAFLAELPSSKAVVLDIGCGPGNVCAYLLATAPTLEVTGIDLAPEMIRLARINVPGARFDVADAAELSVLETKYQGIISAFLLPYLSQEEAKKLIADCRALLMDGGVLYLSCIERPYADSGWERNSLNEPFHQYYHEQVFLADSLAENGFRLQHTFRKVFGDTQGSSPVHLILVATCNQNG
ncbi:MAG: class I SAM-dependent methyltransferase [Sphingobacteriales bacterium]|nr:MAG: class I SAM-dependent methyltransferase [Sphingobacteriales bacterium]